MVDAKADTAIVNTSAAVARRAPVVGSPAVVILLLLTVANALNYLDRSILSILAESIKKDLHVGDAQIGFLYGTVFAALYAIFGIATGRLADRWRRLRLMGLGLGLWSGMTALSAFAGSLAHLALARVGVSAGEAVANPASHALIPDLFPRHRRATAFGVYLTGGVLGGGLALMIGGAVVQAWPHLAPRLGLAGLIRPWQAAFLLCGVPGLLVALLMFRLREPLRGRFEVEPVRPDDGARSAWGAFFADVGVVLPPFSFVSIFRLSPPAGWINVAIAAGLAVVACGLTALTGDWAQWLALAIAGYAIASFAQSMAVRDRAFIDRTFRSPVFICFAVGTAIAGCLNNAVQFWATPYLLRTFHPAHGVGGVTMGVLLAVFGVVGLICGGALTDFLRRRDPRAAIWVLMAAILIPAPVAAVLFNTSDQRIFFAGFACFVMLQSMSQGGAAALVQELMASRMRATGAATFAMLVMVSNFSLGPYLAGKISEASGSLRIGVLSLYALAPVSVFFLLAAARRVGAAVARSDAEATARGLEGMDRVGG